MANAAQYQQMSLAGKVRTWLDDSGVKHPSEETLEFISDLENRHDLKSWAGADYARLIPLRYRNSRPIQFFSMLRNAIVFLPVLLTWLALMDATSSFSDFVASLRSAKAKDISVNFLDYWQSMSGFTRFSTVAKLDVTLIGLVILLTIAIGALETFTGREQKMEQRHAGLMTALEKELNSFRYLTAAELDQAVQGTMKSLLNSAQQIELATQQLNAAGKVAFDSVDNVRLVTAQSFQPLLAQLQTTIDGLGAAAGSHQQMLDLVNQTRGQLAAQLDATRTGFADIVRNVSTDGTALVSSIGNSLHSATSAISQAANDVSLQLAQRLSSELATMGTTVQTAASTLESSMLSVTGSLNSTTDRLSQTLATLEYGIKQIRDDLEATRTYLGGRP